MQDLIGLDAGEVDRAAARQDQIGGRSSPLTTGKGPVDAVGIVGVKAAHDDIVAVVVAGDEPISTRAPKDIVIQSAGQGVVAIAARSTLKPRVQVMHNRAR